MISLSFLGEEIITHISEYTWNRHISYFCQRFVSDLFLYSLALMQVFTSFSNPFHCGRIIENEIYAYAHGAIFAVSPFTQLLTPTCPQLILVRVSLPLLKCPHELCAWSLAYCELVPWVLLKHKCSLFFWHFSCLHVSRAICFHCCTFLSLPHSEVGKLHIRGFIFMPQEGRTWKKVYLMWWKTNFTDKMDVWSYHFVT